MQQKENNNDHSGGLAGGGTWERPCAHKKMQTKTEKGVF